ncbi:histidine kinase [Streptomyces sp. ISL-12]|uniref:sensor histidine kinase n=1 Tax=Streptomyces sp. ISL-12 TaxID=2819177 RepID=UPI0027E1AE0F|nr:histidine kinase [Streptomyces sp. ISL-12]
MAEATVAAWVRSGRDAAARWNALGVVTRDAVGTVLLAPVVFAPVTASIGAQFGDLPQRPYDLPGVLLTAALWLPLAVRRRWPGACLVLVALAFGVRELIAYPPVFASVGLYAALYAAGAHGGRTADRVLPGAGTALYVAFALGLHARGAPHDGAVYTLMYLVLAAFWGAGRTVRARRAAEADRRRLAAEAAVVRERAGIARELHDVVTHHVTAMVVQADAAQYMLDAAPDKVATGLGAISDAGRHALTDLQYLLGVLKAADGPPDHGAPAAPAPGSLADLVAQTRAAGQPVELAESGERRPMASAVELAAYRVVQEALTNALKHAPGRPTRVRVAYGAERLEVEVVTEATEAAVPVGSAGPRPLGRGGGHGLIGLRERVSVCGGELEAGPRPDGGFGVHARIPLTEAA